jgi:hypothetical protein
MKARPYVPQDSNLWEALIPTSANGTLLHTRRFLEYHGQRFIEKSLVFEDDKGKPTGVLPAVSKKNEPDLVMSHAGATFGGLVLKGHADIEHRREAMNAMIEAFAAQGIRRLLYTPTPSFLASQPSQIDLHLLLALGAKVVRADLTSVLNVDRPFVLNKGRRWGMRRAMTEGLHVELDGSENAYQAFYTLLAENLLDRHGTTPTHSLKEMIDLKERLCDDALLFSIMKSNGELVGGSWVLRYTRTVWHTQYIASSPSGRDLKANDLLLGHLLEQAKQENVRTLSLGTSTDSVSGNTDLGLFRFKSHFGAGNELLSSLALDLHRVTE